MVYYIVDAGTRAAVLETWITMGKVAAVMLVVCVVGLIWAVHGMHEGR